MKTKLSFQIVYNPKIINQIGNLMSKMDLGINGLVQPVAEILSFTTTTKVDKNYISKITDKIKEAYETQGNIVLDLNLVSQEKTK